jgi:hypothetical protein
VQAAPSFSVGPLFKSPGPSANKGIVMVSCADDNFGDGRSRRVRILKIRANELLDTREILRNQSFASTLTDSALVAALADATNFKIRTSKLLKGGISSHDQ